MLSARVATFTRPLGSVPPPSTVSAVTSFLSFLRLRVVEEAADRVFMAARLFVRFFNQRGASLQQRILELLAVADSADTFHKKTVTASVGGGVASVAGSVTTITGLILAPFTAGTSLIVTAVGIGVATAGGVASASANITDTMHSKTDRKKVEKMIQDYEEEIKDIKECLEFLQVRNDQNTCFTSADVLGTMARNCPLQRDRKGWRPSKSGTLSSTPRASQRSTSTKTSST